MEETNNAAIAGNASLELKSSNSGLYEEEGLILSKEKGEETLAASTNVINVILNNIEARIVSAIEQEDTGYYDDGYDLPIDPAAFDPEQEAINNFIVETSAGYVGAVSNVEADSSALEALTVANTDANTANDTSTII